MPAFAELRMDQGCTFSLTITVANDSTNASINLASSSFRSQMRKSSYSTNAAANLVCTVTDAANGRLTLSLAAGNTTNIRAGRYMYDVEMTDNNGIVTRVLEGVMDVYPEVTR
jgi:hypothetical protein